MSRTIFTAVAICCLGPTLRAGDLDSPRERTFKATNDGSEQAYMELLPAGFQGDEPHDLILRIARSMALPQCSSR